MCVLLPHQQRHDQTSEALGLFVVWVTGQAESTATCVDELHELRGHLLRITDHRDSRAGRTSVMPVHRWGVILLPAVCDNSR